MYPAEYLEYLVYFHADRDYFECHEILEEYWKEQGMNNLVWVGLIQIAVSQYHYRRGNMAGAYKMLYSAISLLEQKQNEVEQLGFHASELLTLLNKNLQSMNDNMPYHSLQLPLKEPVIKECQSLCSQRGVIWGTTSDLSNEFLLHKHTLRDRSDVVQERSKQAQLKKRS